MPAPPPPEAPSASASAMGAPDRARRLGNMVDLLEELEKNYTDMLHMFMNTSRRLVENAAFVQAVSEATRGVDDGDVRRVAAVKERLQRSLTSVREDFVKQTQQIVDSPVFSAGLKKKVQELRESTKRLDENTKGGGGGGGGGKKRGTASAGGGAAGRRRASTRRS